MTVEEVNVALGTVEFREQILLHMAVFAGFRPGEMLALQRRHVSEDATVVRVEQRVYRGDIDDPKTDPKSACCFWSPGCKSGQAWMPSWLMPARYRELLSSPD